VPPIPCKAAIALWALVAVGSYFTAVDPPYTLGEIKNEVGYALLAFFTFFALIADEARLRLAWLALSVAFGVIALGALGTFVWTGEWPPQAWFGGSPSTTNYFVTAGPVVVLGAWLWLPRQFPAVLAATAGLVAVLGVLSGQRAIWPAVGAQALLAGWWLWRSGAVPVRGQRLAFVAVFAVVVPLGGLFATEYLRTDGDLDAPSSMQQDLRLHVWGKVAQRIAEEPLTGAGLGRRALYKAHPDLIPPENTLFWHTHNMVLNWGVSAGVPGILAILLLFAAFGRRFWQLARSADPRLRAIGLAGSLVVVGLFARNMFNDFFVRDGALLFWALAGALLGYAGRLKQ
jgi:O-antigen ligase